ncbi:RPP40 [Plasmopara halstedii]|uniref:RPP40 n=1 Tax=Plasmopara halstedii TaxID=4781 RepID=A0A0P1AFZ1_PLAHL|nr:RPP40 [Plasmopara halstedii]CEG40022.1 RPP40 [Plasmopara halstedii]|eukprot:XP_024576391.1 RPP40 [Plasmopara halstedii]
MPRHDRLKNGGALLQSSRACGYPSSRLLVWRSTFNHVASRHESIISNHAFNQQLEVYLPSSAGKAVAQLLQWETGFYYEIKASVDMFLSPSFIREYLMEGNTAFMLAKNAAVDASQSAMLLPSGQLLLLVDVDTYQQLGLVGEKYGKALPAACRSAHQKRAQKYVITLDLTSPTFAEDKENKVRDKVRTCLRTKLQDLNMLLCAYNQRGALRTILFEHDQIHRSRLELNADLTTFSDIFLPHFDAFYSNLCALEELGERDGEKLRTSLHEAYEWLGLVACGLTDLLKREKPEDYVSTFTGIPDSFECESACEITTVRWRGLLAAPFCNTIVKKVQLAVKRGDLPWGAVTVWGFPDVFVSWVQSKANSSNVKKKDLQRREHGFLSNGKNNYTLLILPNEQYFLLQAIGPHDETV